MGLRKYNISYYVFIIMQRSVIVIDYRFLLVIVIVKKINVDFLKIGQNILFLNKIFIIIAHILISLI